MHFEMEKNIKEYSLRYWEIYLILNCIFNEEFILNNIISLKEARTKLMTENYLDLGLFVCEIKNYNGLRRWLDALQKRIESRIDVYQEELRKIHDCRSVITEEKGLMFKKYR